MIKYTEKQKLDAVAAYEKGTAGLKATAEAHGVGVDSLRKWVELFRARGLAGIKRKRRSSYDAEFKPVLRRTEDEGLSSRQAAALFDLRRFDVVAEWSRLYADHGMAALQPGWNGIQVRMNKKPIWRDDAAAPGDDRRSREELLREVQQLRMENAYLKKAHALVRAKTRSAPTKGR
jgi:transposase